VEKKENGRKEENNLQTDQIPSLVEVKINHRKDFEEDLGKNEEIEKGEDTLEDELRNLTSVEEFVNFSQNINNKIT